MTTSTKCVPGFDIDTNDVATPSSVPDLTRSLRENHELVQDLCRYAENLASESAVRKRWRLSEETWEALGADDELIRAIEEERVRRIRSGATKRELAQAAIIRGPAALAAIMDSPTANDRHKVDAIKTLNSLADPGPEAAAEQDRIFIRIDLSAGSDVKDPKNVLEIETVARSPKQIEADHRENDEWRRRFSNGWGKDDRSQHRPKQQAKTRPRNS